MIDRPLGALSGTRKRVADGPHDILDTLPYAVCALHLEPDGTLGIDFGGDRLEALFGLAPGALDAGAAPLCRRIVARERRALRARLGDSKDDPEPWSEQFRVQHPQRQVIWLEADAVPRPAAGRNVVWNVVVREVTGSKRVEQELCAATQRQAVDLAAMTHLQHIAALDIKEGDLHAVLGKVVEAALEVTGSTAGGLLLLDAATCRLELAVQRGMPDELGAVCPFCQPGDQPGGPCAMVLSSGAPVVVTDLADAAGYFTETYRRLVIAAGVRAAAFVPLINRAGELMGISVTYFTTPRQPAEHELRILDLLARQASDIAERYQADCERARLQEALRQSEALLRQTERLSRVGGWEYDVARATVTWTEEVYRIHGVGPDYDPSNLVQDIGFYQEEDRPRIAAAFDAAVEQGQPYDLLLRLVDARGRRLWVRTSGEVERHAGRVVRVFGNIIDVTEQEEVAQALQENEERLRLALQVTGTGTWDWDLVRDRWRCSANCHVLLGYSRAAADRESPVRLDVIDVADRDWVLERLAQIRLAGQAEFDIEFRVRRADGSCCWTNAVGRAIEFNDLGKPTRMLGLVSDITREREAEVALKRHAEELRIAYRRLAEARECERRALAMELHDQVGQILTVIGLNLNLVARELLPRAPQHIAQRLHDTLDLVRDLGQRTRHLTADLRPTVLDDYGVHAALGWWVRGMVQHPGIEIVVSEADPQLRLSRETETALFRVAQEAVTNTLKHAAAGRIEIRFVRCARGVRLVVEDDGVGFDPNPPSGHEPAPTWGLLGMRERMAAVGGQVQIDSVPGRGTRITAEVQLDHQSAT
jgi:two-component system sensor histidine kinase UhpB